jgi:hypothetical protein
MSIRDRVKRLFSRSAEFDTAPATLPAAIAEKPVTSRPNPRQVVQTRWRVERVHDGVTYRAENVVDGVSAVEAWEAYQDADLPGVFSFYDGPHCRGRFSR